MGTAFVNVNVKRVTATDLRDSLKDCLRAARDNRVVLIENRRQSAKYLVDKKFLDTLMNERDSILATLEILADRSLTDRLLNLSKTIDSDFAAGRLLTTADAFGIVFSEAQAFVVYATRRPKPRAQGGGFF